jgi:hypothetical protein
VDLNCILKKAHALDISHYIERYIIVLLLAAAAKLVERSNAPSVNK